MRSAFVPDLYANDEPIEAAPDHDAAENWSWWQRGGNRIVNGEVSATFDDENDGEIAGGLTKDDREYLKAKYFGSVPRGR